MFAGSHRLNGNGEVTGLEWVLQAWERPRDDLFWALPVVAETWDGVLNDVHGFHVPAQDAMEAYAAASDGPVPEGGVRGGTGMTCHGFKGGTGTASRALAPDAGGWTVGVLVQANHGRRHRLTFNGAPVGREIPADIVPLPCRRS